MSKANGVGTVFIEDAKIVMRNFAGAEGQYNRAGDRNFGVLLPKDVAEAMLEDGWNVKYLKVREEGDEPQAWIAVSASFDNRPPKIIQVTSKGRNIISEDLVETLDYADFAMVDLILNPSRWVVGDKSGIKAYLKSMVVTLNEDELDLKYALNVDDQ